MNLEIYTWKCALTGVSWKYFGKSTCNLCGLWLTMTSQHLANKFIQMLTNGWWSLDHIEAGQQMFLHQFAWNRIITRAPYECNTLVIFGCVLNCYTCALQKQYSCHLQLNLCVSFAWYALLLGCLVRIVHCVHYSSAASYCSFGVHCCMLCICALRKQKRHLRWM